MLTCLLLIHGLPQLYHILMSYFISFDVCGRRGFRYFHSVYGWEMIHIHMPGQIMDVKDLVMSSNQLEATWALTNLRYFGNKWPLASYLVQREFQLWYFRNKCSISPIPCGVILLSSVKQWFLIFFAFFLNPNLLQKIPPHTVWAPSSQAHWQAGVSPAHHWFWSAQLCFKRVRSMWSRDTRDLWKRVGWVTVQKIRQISLLMTKLGKYQVGWVGGRVGLVESTRDGRQSFWCNKIAGIDKLPAAS